VLGWADVTQGRVTTTGVVEPLDVVEHVGPSLVPGPIHLSIRAFGLERLEEALHRRVVPAIAGSAHAASNPHLVEQALELVAGVLAAAIGMVQHRLGL